MEPYVHEDNHGSRLDIRTTDEGNAAKVGAFDRDGGAICYVSALEIPAITAALYEACGQQSPVILPRPDISLPADGAPLCCGDLSLRMYEDGISMGLPGITAAAISPDALRRRAAFMAVYADAVEAEPCPADVDALAMVLVDGTGAMGLDGARPLARKILAAGYSRESRNG